MNSSEIVTICRMPIHLESMVTPPGVEAELRSREKDPENGDSIGSSETPTPQESKHTEWWPAVKDFWK